MTALITLFALTAFGLLAYYYAPAPGEPPWYPDRFRPFPQDDPGPSSYDMHRQLADLAALRAHREERTSSADAPENGSERSTSPEVA